jgi:hypothetical protein
MKHFETEERPMKHKTAEEIKASEEYQNIKKLANLAYKQEFGLEGFGRLGSSDYQTIDLIATFSMKQVAAEREQSKKLVEALEEIIKIGNAGKSLPKIDSQASAKARAALSSYRNKTEEK